LELPTVIILKTNDVVFAEIISSLHFYENEIRVAGVLNSMSGGDRDVDRLAGLHENLFAITSDLCGSFNYEPVFRAL
jgi:hypothetical protein